MTTVMRPAADWELARFLTEASADGLPIEVIGGHTKSRMGRPRIEAAVVTTHVLRSIRYYDPAARMITVQAGCLVADIERELAGNRQMLAFEPLVMGPVVGNEGHRGTIGGLIATNFAGSRRIAGGGIRDNLLGIRAVSGAGRIFNTGGELMRHATGSDIGRLLVGSWGMLATVVEATFRVVPIPEVHDTAILLGLSEEIAVEAMSTALTVPVGVTGTVHLEPPLAGRLWNEDLNRMGQAVTAIRVEGDNAALPERLTRLREALQPFGDTHLIGHEPSMAFWSELRELSPFQRSDRPLWRVVTRPTKAFEVLSGVRRYMQVDAMLDWSGGLLWLEIPHSADAGATDVRRVLASCGGHATLVRASPEVRAAVEVFQPMSHGIELMTRRLQQAFDPAGILNPGRMYAMI